MNALVHSAGFLASVQDLGRTGFRQSGVSVGGALDTHAMRVANALAGNPSGAAGLEVTLGKLQLQFEDARMVAWCGGAFTVRIGDQNLPAGHAGLVTKGDELTMTAPQRGGRAWLAISGGINVPRVLGSRSTDLRGSFGGFRGTRLARRRRAAPGAREKISVKKTDRFGMAGAGPVGHNRPRVLPCCASCAGRTGTVFCRALTRRWS